MPTSPPPSPTPSFDVWTQGPPADETCVVSRVVRRGNLTLTVWTCKAPAESWPRDWFVPRRFPASSVDELWPGASSAYWEGPGIGGYVRFVVYDGGPRRRRRAERFDQHEWLMWRKRGDAERAAERLGREALED